VAGDLISELDVTATSDAGSAGAGGTLEVSRGSDVRVTVRFRDPDTPNANGGSPTVSRVDVIAGQITGPARDRNADRGGTAKVIERVARDAWRSASDSHTFTVSMSGLQSSMYVRVRGTSTGDAEPPMDGPGENPWTDLWFYSNPIFIEVR
jgi:hypothetical protein